jgi:hypothetical protein
MPDASSSPDVLDGRTRFLTAEWRNLTLVSYALDPDRVESVLPDGLAPDTREGKAYASLVAFDFANARVLGVGIPRHRTFPEFNLRVYVRHPASGARGVVFVRELVPRRLVAWVARGLYGEPYATASMQNLRRAGPETVTLTYRFDWKGREQRLRVEAGREGTVPGPDSLARFLIDRRWGFGTGPTGRLLRYRVAHPLWAVREAREHHLTLDWERVYGRRWAALKEAAPASVLVADGSDVAVSWRETMKG